MEIQFQHIGVKLDLHIQYLFFEQKRWYLIESLHKKSTKSTYNPVQGIVGHWGMPNMLTPKVPRACFCNKKTLKTAISIAFVQENNKKTFFLESNCRILYFTCLKSCAKNFIKFDHIDWKILASKVEQNFFFKKMLRLLEKQDCP